MADRNETCPTWTFASAYEYLQSLPRHAWTKGYRVRVLDVLSRIVQAPDTPPKWDDVWFTCFKNCGDGSLAEAKRLLSLHDAAPTPAPREDSRRSPAGHHRSRRARRGRAGATQGGALVVTYEIVPALGELAVDFAWRLVQYADATNAPHTGVFNGTTMLAHPGDRARQADRARAVRERWQENRAWMVGERKA